MKKLYVYADFDWMKEAVLIGGVSYESLRGSDSYGFKIRWKKCNEVAFIPLKKCNDGRKLLSK